jgi:hypothetical protein
VEEHGGPTRVTAQQRSGQSRLGIASSVIAILTTILFVVLLVVVFNAAGRLLGGADPQGVTPQDLQRNLEQNPGTTGVLGVAGFGLAATPLLYLLGAALGIAGLVQKHRGRLYAVLGTVSNGLIFLGLLVLVLFLVVVGTTL